MENDTVGVISSTRWLNVGVERVFRAFSDPAQLVRWWGPNGFSNTFHEFNLVAGGRWHLTMHSPDGTSYPLEKRFVEVVPNERLVLRQIGGIHQFTMTMTFSMENGGTRITWLMQFDSAEEGERVRPFITLANEENFDRLELHLSAKTCPEQLRS
jgi:uncharacterized protein YndB with AHSA1/START domain